MKKLMVSIICAAAFLATSNSYAGETCDAGHDCSVTCTYGDWCIAIWKLPNGPCTTRCPSKPISVTASIAATADTTQAKALNALSMDTLNAPVSVLQEVISDANQATQEQTPSPIVAANSIDGAKLFSKKCKQCHSVDKKKAGPAIKAMSQDTTQLRDVVTNGGKGMMKAYGKKFSVEEINALVRYMRSKQ